MEFLSITSWATCFIAFLYKISGYRIDNLGKARGFAEYARQNPGVGRIQLIRMAKDAVGHNRFKRLDMAMSAVRDKVARAMTNDELDHIFDTDGFFME